MSTVLDQSSLFSDASFVGWKAQFSGSQGILQGISTTPTYAPSAGFLGMDSVAPLTTTFHIYFKVQGYNTATNSYETWHCRDVPIYLPPSGHNLQNVSIIASWIDR